MGLLMGLLMGPFLEIQRNRDTHVLSASALGRTSTTRNLAPNFLITVNENKPHNGWTVWPRSTPVPVWRYREAWRTTPGSGHGPTAFN